MQMLPALQERNYEFAVVTSGDWGFPDEMDYNGTPIYRFRFCRRGTRIPIGRRAPHCDPGARSKAGSLPD